MLVGVPNLTTLPVRAFRSRLDAVNRDRYVEEFEMNRRELDYCNPRLFHLVDFGPTKTCALSTERRASWIW